jgi:hypothetical protein
VWVNIFIFFNFFICVFCSTLALVKNHTYEWNTFTSLFIDWEVYYFHIFIYFFIVFIYSEIEFIKSLDDIRIQRKTIIFMKNWEYHTVFINKMINSGIMKMFILFFKIFIFIYFILLVKCYAFALSIVFILVWEMFLFYFNDFIFLLFNNLMRNRHCIWIETTCLEKWLVRQSWLFLLFFTFLFNYLILLL